MCQEQPSGLQNPQGTPRWVISRLQINRFSNFPIHHSTVPSTEPQATRCPTLGLPPVGTPSLSKWFAEEVQPHELELRAYLRRSFPSLADIDDLLQETYSRVFRAKTAGKISEARPYLFATARNTACDTFRRSKIVSFTRLVDLERLSVVADGPGVVESIEHAQEVEILREAIGALPTRCRQVLTLCKLYGLSHREVATQLGISEHTVNAQVALGVMRCRDFLRARGVMKERAS